MVGAISGLSLAKFWLGLMLMYLFALKLRLAAELRLWRRRPAQPDPAGDRARASAPMALLARTTRAAVLDVLNADFVRTARCKGMSERRVVEWHVLRNALVLVLTTSACSSAR